MPDDHRTQIGASQETTLRRHANGSAHSIWQTSAASLGRSLSLVKGQRHKPSGPALIRYLTTDMSRALDIDVGFTVDKIVKGDEHITADFLPAGRYATLLYTGPYKGKGIFKATVALLDWAKENKVKWNITKKKGVEWWNGRTEFYFSDPSTEKDPTKFQTELAFLVK